jgi:polyisoprenoid-binding protein YceI
METTKWKADPVHSEIQFKVRHLRITTVTGYFREFNVEVETVEMTLQGLKNFVYHGHKFDQH